VTRAPLQKRSRRDELLARCQQQRYELVAAVAAAKARIPGARRMTHWLRAVSRMLRGTSRGA
jgi:predicted DCC family thiol-disulfide oxidoreductase YuxK